MMRIVMALVLSLLATAIARAQSHPEELLKEPWIRSAWSQALKGERFERWDSWIPGLAGVGSAPFPYRDAAGVSWLVGQVCQPHNCADNKLVVVIDRERRRIWGLQQTAGPASSRYFGNPDRPTAEFLRFASALDPNTVQDRSSVVTPQGGQMANAAPATIEGELTYPSDYIPNDMSVCAETADRKRICTTRKQTRRGRTLYQLSLPPGEYLVFAQTRDMPGVRAYFSEFVTCGYDASCRSHKPIPVVVGPGERRGGVSPGDWYVN